MGVKNPNAGIFDILKILALFRALKLKMAFFGDFCVFTLLHGPGKPEKNPNFKNSRIRIVKHPIIMTHYTEIHENSMKTETR